MTHTIRFWYWFYVPTLHILIKLRNVFRSRTPYT